MFRFPRSILSLDRNTYDILVIVIIGCLAAWWSFPRLMSTYLLGGGFGQYPSPSRRVTTMVSTPTPTPAPTPMSTP